MGLTFRLGQIPLGVFTDTSNNVGIGGSPSGTYKLEVTGSAKVSTTLLVSGAATFSSSVTMDYNFNGSSWFTAKNTNAGSGAAAGLLMTNNGGDLAAISLLSSTNSPANALFIRTLSTNSLVLGTNSGTNLTIVNGGAATFSSSVAGVTGNFTNSTSGNTFIIGTTYASGRNIQIGFSDGSILPTAAAYINDNTGVGVYIGDNSASTKGLYVKNGGNVGIGTSSPSYLLDLQTPYSTNKTLLRLGNNTASAANGDKLNIDFFSYNDNYINARISREITDYTTYAGALTFATGQSGSVTERMRITSGGNIIINGTTAQNNGTNRGNLTLDGATSIINLATNGTNSGYIFHSDTDLLIVNAKNGVQKFYTNDTERVRITSGGALQMSNNSYTFSIGSIAGVQRIQYGTGGYTTEFAFLNTSDGYTPIGASAFNTRSDYRLKEDLKDFSGLSLVTNMKVYDFKWKEKDERNYGFMAHELQEVVSYIVTGEKDGMFEDEAQYQGLDYSKIVPILVKAIQEQQATIISLNDRLTKAGI